MNIELKPDSPVTNDACQAATGASLTQWFDRIAEQPGIETKRRETIHWLYEYNGKDLWWATTTWVEFQKSKGVVLKDGRPDGYNICVTKSIAAPVSEVFAAFGSSQVGSWLGCEADAEGNLADSHGNTGKAIRIRQDKDLRYVWQTATHPPTELDIAFVEKNGKTGITLNHARIQTREEADGLRRAWGQALDTLKFLLEQPK